MNKLVAWHKKRIRKVPYVVLVWTLLGEFLIAISFASLFRQQLLIIQLPLLFVSAAVLLLYVNIVYITWHQKQKTPYWQHVSAHGTSHFLVMSLTTFTPQIPFAPVLLVAGILFILPGISGIMFPGR